MTAKSPRANAQIRMMTAARIGPAHFPLGPGHSLVIGHWSLVIPRAGYLQPRFFALIALLLLVAISSSVATEFDSLRLKWRDMLTFGTNATKSDTNFYAWISSIESDSQSYKIGVALGCV